MNNKSLTNKVRLWIDLYKDDLISGLKLMVPIMLLILALKEVPLLTRKYHLSKLDSEIFGVIDSIEIREGVQHSETGGKVVVNNYNLSYHYEIKGQRINNSETVNKTSITIRQKVKLDKIRRDDTIVIKYDSANFKNAKIKLN